MAIRVRRAVLRYLAVALFLLAGGFTCWTLLSLTSGIRERRALGRIVRSNQDHATLMRDAEGGQRGYIMTGRAGYLAPYTAAVSEMSSPGYAPPAWCAAESRAKLAELARTVVYQRAERHDDAMAIVLTDEGDRIMGRIRAEERTTRTRLRARIDALDEFLITRAVLALWVVPTMMGMTFAATWFSLRAAERDSARRLAAERKTNDEMVVAAEAMDQVMEAERRRSELVGDIAHDIRNPLTAIAMNLTVAAEGGPAEMARGIAVSLDVTSRLARLVNRFLDFASITQSSTQPDPSPFHVLSLLREVVVVAGPIADSKGLAIDIVCPPSVVAVADRAMTFRCVQNFVDNAVKYTSEGRITIGASSSDDGGSLISVADTGPGMASPVLGNLGRIGYRAENPSRDLAGGFGFGMSISHRLAKVMGGRIDVVSEVGRGSTFTLVLPGVGVAAVAGVGTPVG